MKYDKIMVCISFPCDNFLQGSIHILFHFQHGFIFAGGSFDEFRPSPQEDVATIMDMGFGEDVAKEALVLSHNDVERAIHLLLS